MENSYMHPGNIRRYAYHPASTNRLLHIIISSSIVECVQAHTITLTSDGLRNRIISRDANVLYTCKLSYRVPSVG